MSTKTLLLIIALILFILGALPIPTRGFSLLSLGLAFITGSFLVG